MDYQELLQEFQSDLRFLELKSDVDFKVFRLPSALSVPLSSEAVVSKASTEMSFSIKNILQNMMVLTALCKDFPLNPYYNAILTQLFSNLDDVSIYALIDMSDVSSDIKKAGILSAFAKYRPNYASLLSEAKGFFLLYEKTKDGALLDQAESSFLKSLDLQQTSEASYFLSFLYHFKEDYERAYQYALKVLDLNPTEEEEAQIVGQLAYIRSLRDSEEAEKLLHQGDYEAAITLLNQDEDGGSYLKSRILGEAYLRLGEPDEALNHLKRALDLKMDDAKTHYLTAESALALGDFSNATRFYESALKLEPRNVEYIKKVADCYSRTSREERAYKLLEKAHKFEPGDEEVVNMMAGLKMRMEDGKDEGGETGRNQGEE